MILIGSSVAPVPPMAAGEPPASDAPAKPLAVPPAGDRAGTGLAEKASLMASGADSAAGIGDLQVIPYDGSIIMATRLAERIMGGRGTISNATLLGASRAAGLFLGGGRMFGVRDGIVLSSGDVNSVLGPIAIGPSRVVVVYQHQPGNSDIYAKTRAVP